MKKFLSVLLVGGLLASTVMAFNGYGRTDNNPLPQNQTGNIVQQDFSIEGKITSIGEYSDGIIELSVDVDGQIYKVHLNDKFSNYAVGDTIKVDGWLSEIDGMEYVKAQTINEEATMQLRMRDGTGDQVQDRFSNQNNTSNQKNNRNSRQTPSGKRGRF